MSRRQILSISTVWHAAKDRGTWGRLFHTLGDLAPGVWILIVTLLGGGTYYAWRVRPLEERVIQVTQQASTLSRLPAAHKTEGDDPAIQLAEFYASFPRTRELPDSMQTLYDAAQSEGLTLERGDYRLVREHGDCYGRYEISLPVKGSYPQLRRFLAKVVSTLPTLAVDEVQFSRSQIADALVECRLSMSLYLAE